jgi:hypothetical protein
MNTEQQAASSMARQDPASRPGPPAASRAAALLLPAQRDVLRQALADAVYYRDPPLYCPTCEILDRLCGQCATGLSQALAYVTLGRELGISPEDLADAATH